MKNNKFLISFLSVLSLFFSNNILADTRDTITLDGEWLYRLTGAPSSIPGEGYISLPSTLDNEKKSVYSPQSDNTSQLRREFSFSGQSTYSKEINIPKDWNGKQIELFIERTKPSYIKIDGKYAGKNSRISSPQKYDLTKFLTPGKHRIEIAVNNADSIPPIVARSSNAVSESTQTNWNGILGQFFLEAKNSFNISNVLFDEMSKKDSVVFSVNFSERAPGNLKLKFQSDEYPPFEQKIKIGSSSLNFSLPLDKFKLWSTANTNLSTFNFSIINSSGETIDDYNLETGLRKFGTEGTLFTINSLPVFLRGTVNAAVFPKTTYAPLDLKSWINYFSTLKDYGFNHIRFHSWTPPEAAFKAADITGIYILAELPIWGELDRDLVFHNRFLNEDLNGIMESYSHHPSFVLFSPGNELWGDISLMGEYMKKAKRLNPRILSTYGSNVYLGMNGRIGEEDFVLSAKTSDDADKSVRGSVSFADSDNGGLFNSTYPNSSFNFAAETEGFGVPIISHEVGQYQSYPDYSEIELYTGNLKPDNLIEFKKRAEEAGLADKSSKFLEASGKWAAKLYKAEMELAQRSPGIGGFELFGLQDYPGQGTAVIGMLNPFMYSKGFISPEEFKQSSDDIAILAELPKFIFSEQEEVNIPVTLLNYSENPESVNLIEWETGFAKGSLPVRPFHGKQNVGEISFKVPNVGSPRKYTLNLTSQDKKVTNQYDIYVFPEKLPPIKNVSVTDNMTEALILLDQGEKVLLMPDTATVSKASIDPLFTTDFWNYRMFRTICDEMHLKPSPGTLGLFIDDSHPALKKFPTQNHTDWQWYAIVKNSRPLIIDRLPKNFNPVIEVIDNVERNFRLALLLECKVGKGKLMIFSANEKELMKYPEGRWIIQSIKEYMAGKEFNPKVSLSPEQVVNLLTKPSNARLIKELKNETYNSKWE